MNNGYSQFPDHRSGRQIRIDRAHARRQVQVLAPDADRERRERIIDQIRARQMRAPRRYAVPFYRYPVTNSAGQDTYVLCAEGQLVVRVDEPQGAAPYGASAAAPRAGSSDVQAALAKLGYRTVSTPGGKAWESRTRVYAGRKSPTELKADVARLRRQGVTVSPNLIVPLGHIIKGDDYPSATTGPGAFPPAGAPAALSTDVRVALIDTGITPEDRTDDWLDAIRRQPDNTDLLDVLPDDGHGHGDGRVDWFGGHGSFAAGIVQQVAPFCEIVAYRFTHSDGLGTEKDVAEAMIRAAEEGTRDKVRLIINASIGTMGVDGAPPPAMQDAVQLIRERHPEVLIVASAGNMGTDDPVYPAALDGVTAVGSLTDDLRPAPFSSFGSWVDCSTVGVGLVSTFVAGIEPPEPDPLVADIVFGPNSWALWSGTSFSAPQISALVARACQADPAVQPRAALEALLAGTPEEPGYGRVLRVLPGTPS